MKKSEILKAQVTTDTLMVSPNGIQEFKIQIIVSMTLTIPMLSNIHNKSRNHIMVEIVPSFIKSIINFLKTQRLEGSSISI
jgi:hypothetical protein